MFLLFHIGGLISFIISFEAFLILNHLSSVTSTNNSLVFKLIQWGIFWTNYNCINHIFRGDSCSIRFYIFCDTFRKSLCSAEEQQLWSGYTQKVISYYLQLALELLFCRCQYFFPVQLTSFLLHLAPFSRVFFENYVLLPVQTIWYWYSEFKKFINNTCM